VRHFRATSELPHSGGKTDFRDSLKYRTGLKDFFILITPCGNVKKKIRKIRVKKGVRTWLRMDFPAASIPEESLINADENFKMKRGRCMEERERRECGSLRLLSEGASVGCIAVEGGAVDGAGSRRGMGRAKGRCSSPGRRKYKVGVRHGPPQRTVNL
jgi:hypothetical protein